MAPKSNKPVKGYIKLQINGGQATPAPPVGPALGQHGVPIMEFTSRFNEQTRDKMGIKLPVIITVYEDKTFDFIVKQSPMSHLVKAKANLKSGSKLPHKEKVAHLSLQQVKEIATEKMPDLNSVDLAGAMMIVRGTARSAGITTDIDGLVKAEVAAKIA
ncbi:MAG: 50S ribosomal protein L11 [Candidatus Gracilibacteria bacterium]|nr:50S ribosomal protein L11 [Candidatus Gracilibacteria bacterium]